MTDLVKEEKIGQADKFAYISSDDFEKYVHIFEKLGSGGHSTVYSAKWRDRHGGEDHARPKIARRCRAKSKSCEASIIRRSSKSTARVYRRIVFSCKSYTEDPRTSSYTCSEARFAPLQE